MTLNLGRLAKALGRGASAFRGRERGGPQARLGAQVRDLERRRSSGLGAAGLVSTAHPVSGPGWETAQAAGLFYWGTRLFVSPSLEAAREHSRGAAALLAGEPVLQGLYLVGPPVERPVEGAAGLATAAAAAARGLYDFPEPGGRPRFLPPQRVAAALEPAGGAPAFAWRTAGPDLGPRLLVKGWLYPARRGALMLEDALRVRKVRRLLALFRSRWAPWGFTLRFNGDAAGVLDALKDAPRRGQPVEANRWREPRLYEAALARCRAGSALTAEVRAPDGSPAAAVYDAFIGGLHSLPTMYGRDVPVEVSGVRRLVRGIDLANFAVAALLVRLGRAGIPGVDVEWPTRNSLGLGAATIPAERFERSLLALAGREVPLDLRPFEPAELTA